MADEETQAEELDKPDEKPSGRNWLVILLSTAVALLLLAFGLTAGYIVGQMNTPQLIAGIGQIDGVTDADVDEDVEEEDEDEPEKELADAIYLSLRPEFTVNFYDGQKERYLMASLDVMARDQEVIDQIDKDMPVVRYQILRVLGRQDQTLFEEGGKDGMLAEILTAVQGVINSPAGGVEAVYLTSFVVQ